MKVKYKLPNPDFNLGRQVHFIGQKSYYIYMMSVRKVTGLKVLSELWVIVG